ncbi:hypothetical protein GFL91_36085 [Rhizobium leguminosarum bv. viciae]|jgi:hypothetical protein|uniref:Uncharacterized protein n=1 Tax=Rhizobium leguminosarum bv. viciae TaxID=387 RepID=A0A8I2KJ59_RHILV|nr:MULTISPECIES: hypothetical protein [Rhizobium]MBY5421006.1 hypothetical protein [Rhizobium leguminosarum]MBY5427763.1 hypothetical protein [Rhizobium leguminosarum]MBY5754705.1 hypothetical protein [Rhizobium leguminosarum]MBY5775435.1 hypothetical protein [Rhizobium leguminosarum]MBY5795330.1 hypothetical protein [Rhizobium leguminosarum]
MRKTQSRDGLKVVAVAGTFVVLLGFDLKREDCAGLLGFSIRAGHGAGKPIGKVLDEMADLWTFAAYWTGLEVGAAD